MLTIFIVFSFLNTIDLLINLSTICQFSWQLLFLLTLDLFLNFRRISVVTEKDRLAGKRTRSKLLRSGKSIRPTLILKVDRCRCHKITDVSKCLALVEGLATRNVQFLKLVAKRLSLEQCTLFVPSFSSKVRERVTHLGLFPYEQMYIWLDLIYWKSWWLNLEFYF